VSNLLNKLIKKKYVLEIEIFEKPGPVLGLIYCPGPDPGLVVQEKPRKVKNAWAWTLGTGKTQALVQIQLDL